MDKYKTLHFSLCFDENYAKYASVCIKSIYLHHKRHRIVIHVLSDNLDHETILALKQEVEDKNCKLQIHIINGHELANLPRGIWPIHAWYRIILPEILTDDIDRVLYLDCDTLVMSDISELFAIDLTGKAFAAVSDPQQFMDKTYERCGYPCTSGYVCTGVMLFNLNYWRETELKKRLIKFALENKDILSFPDQDSLNILCETEKIILPFNYGVIDAFFYIKDVFHSIPNNELVECIKHPKIIHFAGCAPWKVGTQLPIFFNEWQRVNQTLTNKVRLSDYQRCIRIVKSWMYQMMHPKLVIRRRRNRYSTQKAIRLLGIDPDKLKY